jgi:hypothetical protein
MRYTGPIAVKMSTLLHSMMGRIYFFDFPIAAPFGVKVTALEPGAMRTNWGTRAHASQDSLLPDEPSVGASMRLMKDYWGKENGDPAKVAQVVLKIADADTLPPHILLGSDAIQLAHQAEQARAAAAGRWKAVSASIDMDAVGPIPALPKA